MTIRAHEIKKGLAERHTEVKNIDVSKDMLCYIITCRDMCNKNIKNLLKTC